MAEETSPLPAKSRAVLASVGDAFHRTADLLFKPFSWQRWAKLVFIAWLAGALFGGINLNWAERRAPRLEKKQTVVERQKKAAEPALSRKVQREHEKKYWYEHGLFKSVRDESGKIPAWYMAVVVWPVLILLALLVLALALLLTWLCARFQFVWLHAVQSGEAQVRRPFRLYEAPGDSLATFLVLASFLTLLYYAAALVAPGWLFFTAAQADRQAFADGAVLLAVLWPWLLLLLVSVLVTVLFFTLIADFVVPIMASESLLFKEAFRKWLSVYAANRWAVWRYLLAKAVAMVLAGAFTTAATLVLLVLLALAGLVVFGLAYLVCVTWLKLKMLFWIVAAVLGVPFLTVAVFAFCASALPASVFFRAFSLSFLEKLRPAPG